MFKQITGGRLQSQVPARRLGRLASKPTSRRLALQLAIIGDAERPQAAGRQCPLPRNLSRAGRARGSSSQPHHATSVRRLALLSAILGLWVAKTLLDRVLGVMSACTMAMTLLQLSTLLSEKQAAGVSIWTFGTYLVLALLWLWHG